MTRREGNCLLLEGPVGVGTVATFLPASAGHVRDGVAVVDFAAVTSVDSAAVALALALVREARSAGRDLAFANVPAAMRELAKLYAVSDLIPLAPRQ